MKRILLLILSLYFINHLYAQHLEFMGIPIDGSIEQFEKNLRKKGAYKLSAKQNKYQNSISKTYDGKYAEWALCTIDVIDWKGQGSVAIVSVNMNKYAAYSTRIIEHLKSLYGDYKEENTHFGKTYIWELEYGKVLFTYEKLGDDYYLKIQFRDIKCQTDQEKKEKEEEKKHIEFWGVNFSKGTINLVDNIQGEGFKIDWANSSNGYVLTGGKYMDYLSVIVVEETPKTKKPYSVFIDTGVSSTWADLKSKYNYIKRTLSSKYTIISDVHEFLSPYYDGSGKELSALKYDKCIYKTSFQANGGLVLILITQDAHVCIGYIDEIYQRLNFSESDKY